MPSTTTFAKTGNAYTDGLLMGTKRGTTTFAAYKQRLLPVIHGTVTTISADRLTDERTGFAYYSASVEVDPG